MATITLQNSSLMEVTILSNTFIDNYMPEANGEFVKVYIYLLRSLSNAPVSFSLEQMADRLLCTERDILRALKYWAKQELIALDFTDSNRAALSRRTEADSFFCFRLPGNCFRSRTAGSFISVSVSFRS